MPHYKEPPVVKPYVAAVLKSEFYNYVESQWDLTTLRVSGFFLFKYMLNIEYLNGFFSFLFIKYIDFTIY